MKLKLLKDKNYTLLIIGNLVSLLGSNVQQFVLSLYVLKITGSATIFGSMLAISILPRLFLSPIAGVFGDWFDKKRTIVFLDLVNFAMLLIFAGIFTINNSLSIGWIYVMIILLEITEIFFHSAMSAVLPLIVEKEDLLEANSLRSMIITIGQLIAPVLGAFLFGLFGLLIAILLNSISYLLSAFSELFMKIPKTHAKPKKINLKQFKDDLVAGIRIIKNNQSIKTIIIIATIINFSFAPLFSVGIIYIMKEIMFVTDMQFGIFQTILMLSMVAAPIIMTSRLKKIDLGNYIIKAFFVISVLVFLMGLGTTKFMLTLDNSVLIAYIYITAICFIIGILVTAGNIAIETLIQKIVPIEFMSRTFTVLGLLVAIFIPVGQILFGALFDNVNQVIVISINAGIIFFGILLNYKGLKRITSNQDDPVNEILISD